MLQDKLYFLRRSRALSQEQLAEELDVSRQAISKWESGSAMPESEKLIAISEFFSVSIDYLLKEDVDSEAKMNTDSERLTAPEKRRGKLPFTAGLILSVTGALMLVAFGLISVFFSELRGDVANSSVITLDGNGIFMLLATLIVIFGAVLLLKNYKE